MDLYASGEATYNHLTIEQIKQLEDSVVQNDAWLNQKVYNQSHLPKTADPVVKSSEIYDQKRVSYLFYVLFIFGNYNYSQKYILLGETFTMSAECIFLTVKLYHALLLFS